ncbi:MAG: glycosyltransferase family 39 protein [Polyangiaceae bacterium]
MHPSPSRRDRFVDPAIGGGLAAAYVVWLLSTARSLGFPRDEGFYFRAANEYGRWFKRLFEGDTTVLERAAVDGSWGYNHEHPALMKSLFAISRNLLWEKWKVFEDFSTACRFPAMLMGGLAIAVTYLFAARAYSRRAGVFAAAFLALSPAYFFHAHLACFDIPIVAMWTLCIYVYWRAYTEKSVGWALLLGVVYGLTLETKHNAWILPEVFVVHTFWADRKSILKDLSEGRVSVPTTLLAMATVGPLVFVALWPWLWNDTLPRIQEYAQFHLNHEYYNIEFLGVNYFGPPSPKLYAPVMIFATVPGVALLAFAVGAWTRLRHAIERVKTFVVHTWSPSPNRTAFGVVADVEDRNETDLLVFLGFAAAIAPFFLPKTPIFGGTKHWMTGYPFMMMWAGVGVDRVFDAFAKAFPTTDRTRDRVREVLLAITLLAAPLATTRHSHPFGLSTYMPFVGGSAGGADLGLFRQFWGFTTQSAAKFLATAPPRSTVFIHDTAWDSWATMQFEHRLRPDLVGVGAPHDGTYAILHHELHMEEVDYEVWVAYGTAAPAHVVTHDGVPIVSVYRRP